MSIANTMRYNRTKQFLGRIDNLKSKGEDFVQKIANNLKQQYPGRFKESKNTGTRLTLEFFGVTILVRVELEIEEHQPGRVRIYLCDESTVPRLRKFDLEYMFDDLGNVNADHTIDDAAAEFDLELVEYLRSKEIAWLP